MSGEQYELKPFDKLVFTVKEACNAEPIFQKILEGENTFLLNSSDTENLKDENYVYNVRLIMENDEVYTIIDTHPFKLLRR